MAFIPDNSFDLRLREKLLPILWEFYEYNCRKRNHETRRSNGTIDDFISLYGYKRASKFILQKEIKSSHWFGGSDGNYELLVGDFSPVDKKADERKARREQSKKIDSLENQSKNLDFESKKIDEKSKKIDSHIRNIPASLPAEPEKEYTQDAREFPLKELYEAFPHLELPPGKAGLILADVKEADKAAWLSTIKTYVANYDPSKNRYMPDKIGNLLSVFRSEKTRIEKENESYQKTNGRKENRTDNKRSSVGQTTDEYLASIGASPT